MMHRHEMGRWGGMTMGFDFVGILILILLAIVVVGVIIILVKLVNNQNGKSTTDHNPQQEAFEIISERYAKGEISEDEYIRMKRTLEEK